eukprot:Gb_22131 [translate_table: standard]
MEEVWNDGIRSGSTAVLSPRSVLREQALAAWKFLPSCTVGEKDFDPAQFAQTSQRDMELLTRALERELNSGSNGGKSLNHLGSEKIYQASPICDYNEEIHGYHQTACRPGVNINETHNLSDRASSSISSSGPSSPSHGHMPPTTVAAVEPRANERRKIHTHSAADAKPIHFDGHVNQVPSKSFDQKNIPQKIISKRRSRGANRSPAVTFLTADPANFRSMVQHVTGVPLNTIRSSVSVFKPLPKRPNQSIPGLPTLDTSFAAFDNHISFPGPFSGQLNSELPGNEFMSINNFVGSHPAMNEVLPTGIHAVRPFLPANLTQNSSNSSCSTVKSPYESLLTSRSGNGNLQAWMKSSQISVLSDNSDQRGFEALESFLELNHATTQNVNQVNLWISSDGIHHDSSSRRAL